VSRPSDQPAPVVLGRADLQIHTTRSDGTASPEAIVRYADAHTNLDLIAITDHDDFRGAEEARNAAARTNARVDVIPGIEVTTRSGHLLALYLHDPVPSFRSIEATMEAVWKQDGVVVVPHPLSWLTASYGARSIERVRKHAAASGKVAGIELANPTPVAQLRQRRARRLNRDRWQLAETGGSDAHFLEFIGAAVTRFPGLRPADLRAALIAGLTVAEERPRVGLREIGLRRLIAQQGRGLSATPRATIGRPLRRRLSRVRARSS
jgi:predicted metal-dependent phosphoesterase TrpH